jgi:hypothetical protein
MTTYNKTSLKTYFETNDIPSGDDYANLIDSNLNLVETSQQSMAGPLYTTELTTPKVSASSVTISSNLSAIGNIYCYDLISNYLETGNSYIYNLTVYTSALIENLTVSAGINFSSPKIVSAAGTSQATAANITSIITIGQGSTDGSNTGFVLPSPSIGKMQYFIHEGAVSANLWPSSGCTINGLSANAAYALAANTMYTIIHKTASAYAVK